MSDLICSLETDAMMVEPCLMAQDEIPHLRIVAERSSEEVERERAIDELRWPLIDFAANLLRVIRGAGRSHELREQSFALSDALEKFGQRTGRWPSGYDLEGILREDERPAGSDLDRQMGIESVVAGSLQLTASRLLGQRTQMAAGSSQIAEGIRMVRAAHERMQAEWAAKTIAQAKKPTSKPRASKSRAKPTKPDATSR